MPFKTIVAILQSEQDAERVLDYAVELASQFGSHLIGIHAEAMPVPYTSATGFPDTEFLQVSSDLNKERADRLQAIFLKRIEGARLSFEWRSLETFSGDSALSGIASVRTADLVVAAQREAGGDTSADVDTLVYDVGRPVLVVPHSGPLVTSFKHVLLAWNGSKEAARAAFDDAGQQVTATSRGQPRLRVQILPRGAIGPHDPCEVIEVIVGICGR